MIPPSITSTGCSGLLLLSACWLLQSASPFVTSPRPAGRPAAPRSTYYRRKLCRDSVHRRHATFLAAAEIETDIPGVVDSRLAGWRARKVGAAGSGANEEQINASNAANEGGAGEGIEPVCGNVVEYPLSDLVKEEAADGREKGVAVIVSINKNRNDAWTLPEDILDLAELEVLCPDLDAGEDGVWMSDELEACVFARLGNLHVLKSTFNGAMDKWKRWKIEDELSEGCGARDADWEYDIL